MECLEGGGEGIHERGAVTLYHVLLKAYNQVHTIVSKKTLTSYNSNMQNPYGKLCGRLLDHDRFKMRIDIV